MSCVFVSFRLAQCISLRRHDMCAH